MIAASCLDVRALILPCFILRPTSFAVQTHCSPFPRHLIDETLEKIGKQALLLRPVSCLFSACLFSFQCFRLWGAVSWGSVHVVTGLTIDAAGGSFSILLVRVCISVLS